MTKITNDKPSMLLPFAAVVLIAVLGVTPLDLVQAFLVGPPPRTRSAITGNNANQRSQYVAFESGCLQMAVSSSKLSSSSQNTTGSFGGSDEIDDSSPQEQRRGYQPIEAWEEEQKNKGANVWGDRVQFDGQRFGNQVRQNDILQRHLHSF